MSTYFIADLHLEESRPDISSLFLQFLRQEAPYMKTLYILGDLFEVWIGDDDHSPFNQSIINALQAVCSQGISIYLMRGNRDFLMGKQFMRQTGCRLLPDEKRISLANQPTLLMHGDTLCTRDSDYLRFRKHTRRFLVQKLFLLKSLTKRRAIAQKARQLSHQHTHTTAPEIMDVTLDEVARVMLKHQVLHLIHGHTHRPNIHHFTLNGQAATRTVLAPWHEKGSALLCHEDGRQEFLEITR